MKETKKQRQVATLIQKEFSTVIREEGRFMYSTAAMVTVTNVRMSSDLGIAYIYMSIYNIENKDAIIEKITSNLSRLRGGLGKRIRKQVRRIPVLKFYIDETLDEIDHIDSLFAQLHSEKNTTRSMNDTKKENKD